MEPAAASVHTRSEEHRVLRLEEAFSRDYHIDAKLAQGLEVFLTHPAVNFDRKHQLQ